jgi:hypothetical protein
MLVQHTAVLAISTPDGETNHFSELLELTNDDGTKMFKQIRVGLSCEKCTEAGVKCECKIKPMPSWRTSARQERVEKILAGTPDVMARELHGSIKSSRRPLFEKRWIKAFKERDPYQFPRPPPVVFVAIDPSGGGNQSDFAMASMTFDMTQSKHVVTTVLCDSTH